MFQVTDMKNSIASRKPQPITVVIFDFFASAMQYQFKSPKVTFFWQIIHFCSNFYIRTSSCCYQSQQKTANEQAMLT
jgi:hypothetical protein